MQISNVLIWKVAVEMVISSTFLINGLYYITIVST